jgi:hypothetical protein
MNSSLKTSGFEAERLRRQTTTLPNFGFGTTELFHAFGIFQPRRTSANSGADMPYTRPIRRFYLTPPSIPVFVASVILALLAVLAVYGKVSIFNASYAFLVLLIAYVVLLAGNLFRGV